MPRSPFEWDAIKAKINKQKHGVSFEEAATVFDDPLAAIFDDEIHSVYEAREIIIGQSINQRLVLVCFTERAGSIRIISARRATPRESHDYESGS